MYGPSREAFFTKYFQPPRSLEVYIGVSGEGFVARGQSMLHPRDRNQGCSGSCGTAAQGLSALDFEGLEVEAPSYGIGGSTALCRGFFIAKLHCPHHDDTLPFRVDHRSIGP